MRPVLVAVPVMLGTTCHGRLRPLRGAGVCDSHLCTCDDLLSSSVRGDELSAVVLEFARLVQPFQLLPFRTASGVLCAADYGLLRGARLRTDDLLPHNHLRSMRDGRVCDRLQPDQLQRR